MLFRNTLQQKVAVRWWKTRKHCCGQNVSEKIQKQFLQLGRKLCFPNKFWVRGQTGKHIGKRNNVSLFATTLVLPQQLSCKFGYNWKWTLLIATHGAFTFKATFWPKWSIKMESQVGESYWVASTRCVDSLSTQFNNALAFRAVFNWVSKNQTQSNYNSQSQQT